MAKAKRRTAGDDRDREMQRQASACRQYVERATYNKAKAVGLFTQWAESARNVAAATRVEKTPTGWQRPEAQCAALQLEGAANETLRAIAADDAAGSAIWGARAQRYQVEMKQALNGVFYFRGELYPGHVTEDQYATLEAFEDKDFVALPSGGVNERKQRQRLNDAIAASGYRVEACRGRGLELRRVEV